MVKYTPENTFPKVFVFDDIEGFNDSEGDVFDEIYDDSEGLY